MLLMGREIAVIRILSAALASFVLATTSAIETSQNAASGLPPRLETYLARDVKLTSGQRRRLIDGDPITKLLDADASREVAVFGAIWINAPIHRYVEAVQDIENFERGEAVKVTKRISAPPKLEDFALLHLPDQDVADLRTCRVGDCEVKLGAQALQRFRTEVDWNASDAHAAADTLMQRLALEYVTGYLEAGDERLAVYRDSSRPTFVAAEFRAMIDQIPELTTYEPALRRYLLGYPKVTLPDSTSFLYWQETRFGLKPTIRISHVTIQEGADTTLVVSKMLYASHYFWTGLELRALLPDPSRGSGFWFVSVNRGRSDGLGGFAGMFVRRRARSEAQKAALAWLLTTKRMLEKAP